MPVPHALRARLAYDARLLGAVSRIFVDSILGWYRRRMEIEGAARGQSGAMTVVQRVSADLKLHPHLHAVVLDGVFVAGPGNSLPVFHALPRISDVAVADLLQVIRARLLRYLLRRRVVEVACGACRLARQRSVAGGFGNPPRVPINNDGEGQTRFLADDLAEREPALAQLPAAAVSGLPPQLNHALSAVLMLAHVATRAGDQVGLLAFDSRVRAYLPPQSGRRAAERVIAASYDIHAQIVETDFEAAYGYLSQRLRKRSLVVLFTEVIDDVSAKSVVRTVRGLGPRHLALCVLFRNEALDAMVKPQIRQQEPADLYPRAAAAEAVLWRDRLVRELEEAGALVLHVSPRKLTPSLINRCLQIKAQRLL